MLMLICSSWCWRWSWVQSGYLNHFVLNYRNRAFLSIKRFLSMFSYPPTHWQHIVEISSSSSFWAHFLASFCSREASGFDSTNMRHLSLFQFHVTRSKSCLRVLLIVLYASFDNAITICDKKNFYKVGSVMHAILHLLCQTGNVQDV